jgi:hypothetical protein
VKRGRKQLDLQRIIINDYAVNQHETASFSFIGMVASCVRALYFNRWGNNLLR